MSRVEDARGVFGWRAGCGDEELGRGDCWTSEKERICSLHPADGRRQRDTAARGDDRIRPKLFDIARQHEMLFPVLLADRD